MKPVFPVALIALTCFLPPVCALDASTAPAPAVAPATAAASSASSAGTIQQTGWFDTAELSFVTTGGNSDTTTLGLRNVLRRLWERSRLEIELGVVLSRSQSEQSFGVGSLEDFEVVDPPRTTDAERVFLEAGLERKIHERLFWFVNADAERNLPADIQQRITSSGGVGHSWIEAPELRLSTSYGVTLTREELTGEPNDDFGGYRVGYKLEVKLAGNTSLESDLTFNGNIEEGPDFRVKARNAVTVAVNERVAFKAGLQANFRNRPAQREIVVFDADPSSSAVEGGAVNVLGRAMIENDELDTIFSTSLVFRF